jgi:hypothetical protein
LTKCLPAVFQPKQPPSLYNRLSQFFPYSKWNLIGALAASVLAASALATAFTTTREIDPIIPLPVPVEEPTPDIAIPLLSLSSLALIGGILAYVHSRTHSSATTAKQTPPTHPTNSSNLNIAMSLRPCADITLSSPQQPPLEIHFTFLIDISRSMLSNGKETQVKSALVAIAQKIHALRTQLSQGKVTYDILTFADSVSSLIDHTIQRDLKEIITIINGYKSDKHTKLMPAFEKGVQNVQKVAQSRSEATHVFALLTDGKSEIDEKKIQSLHEQLNKINALSYFIGVAGHTEDVLKRLADIKGKYINITESSDIANRLLSIYESSVTPFTGIRVSSNQLLPEAFSVRDLPPSLSSGQAATGWIELHPEKFTQPTDLTSLCFTVEYTDPHGNKKQNTERWPSYTI